MDKYVPIFKILFSKNSLCNLAVGVDGAVNMIKKAKIRDTKGVYYQNNIETLFSKERFDIIFSMETLYYLKNIESILNKLHTQFLLNNGLIIIGIDHYTENIPSLDWGEKFNLDITTLSIESWITLFESAGFSNIESKQVEAQNDWQGTLIISAYKNL